MIDTKELTNEQREKNYNILKEVQRLIERWDRDESVWDSDTLRAIRWAVKEEMTHKFDRDIIEEWKRKWGIVGNDDKKKDVIEILSKLEESFFNDSEMLKILSSLKMEILND